MLLVRQATICNIISHYRKVGTLSPLRRPGKTPQTSRKSRSFLVRIARICPKITSKQLQRDWTDGHKVHHSTVRRILIKHGLNGRKAARKLLLSKFHAKARFDWCRAVKNNSAQDWDKLIFFPTRVAYNYPEDTYKVCQASSWGTGKILDKKSLDKNAWGLE